MRIQKTASFQPIDTDRDNKWSPEDFGAVKDYLVNIDSDLDKLFKMTHNGLSFGPTVNRTPGNNIFGQWVTVADSGTANTEFSVTHSLAANGISIVPGNYFVTRINKGGVVYDSGTTWTTTTVYLKCSAANATINIFLTR